MFGLNPLKVNIGLPAAWKRLFNLKGKLNFELHPEANWSEEKLKKLLKSKFKGKQVLVASNREPYIHVEDENEIKLTKPASGLISGIEPIMIASGGTWVAHGSGTADKKTVNSSDQIGVPPERPRYTLKRVWLTEEEELHYFDGFSNEGLWPLCHMAHIRPIFRDEDWRAYQAVNEKFAKAILEEINCNDPIIFIQDYHLSLLPLLLREKIPEAIIISFWHIPWPNAEMLQICPWHSDILRGMLGSTIIGFHTKMHCQNFIEAVDRFVEARIEKENLTITHENKETHIGNYPISIAWPEIEVQKAWASVDECKVQICNELELPKGAIIACGVDRMDYTKGICERLAGIEHLLTKHPELIGKFVFVQVASPSRTRLEGYQNLEKRIIEQINNINQKFTSEEGLAPILLLSKSYSQSWLNILYRASQVCVVTSLHDGMNLVCKEYIAAHDDEKGVLILSQFAGASRELVEALIINPYNLEETASAFYKALTMTIQEQQIRMRHLRLIVKKFNVYCWAAKILEDAEAIQRHNYLKKRLKKYECE